MNLSHHFLLGTFCYFHFTLINKQNYNVENSSKFVHDRFLYFYFNTLLNLNRNLNLNLNPHLNFNLNFNLIFDIHIHNLLHCNSNDHSHLILHKLVNPGFSYEAHQVSLGVQNFRLYFNFSIYYKSFVFVLLNVSYRFRLVLHLYFMILHFVIVIFIGHLMNLGPDLFGWV